MNTFTPPDDVLVVNDRIAIPRGELSFRASRAGGPGGQHVNTSSTRVELLWDFRRSGVLDDATRSTLASKLVNRLDRDGALRVVSSSKRSQLQNRQAAEAKLAELVRHALVERTARRKTRVPRRAVEGRLEEKKRRGGRKRERQRRDFE
ncbi:MAG: aminoacyl-tRNA hydrolase [Gemmatimonadaceae bacterium]|nr:aminoacyl-tRNA hydrolase [Gemmatimonadaceae bacterium]